MQLGAEVEIASNAPDLPCIRARSARRGFPQVTTELPGSCTGCHGPASQENSGPHHPGQGKDQVNIPSTECITLFHHQKLKILSQTSVTSRLSPQREFKVPAHVTVGAGEAEIWGGRPAGWGKSPCGSFQQEGSLQTELLLRGLRLLPDTRLPPGPEPPSNIWACNSHHVEAPGKALQTRN